MDVMRRFERLICENLKSALGGMIGQNSMDFDVNALYAALDAQRQSRRLSWQQVAQEVSRQFEDTRARPISPSTLRGMREKRVIEGDGVLQMLRWLHQTPESFVPGYAQTGEDSTLPQIGSHQILRFDAKAIYVALNAQRSKRGMTWKQVAEEIGCNVPSLTRLASGGRVGFPDVMRIFGWLGRPAAAFTRASNW